MYRIKILPFSLAAILIFFLSGCTEKDKTSLKAREEASVPDEYVQFIKNRLVKDSPFYYISSSSITYFDTLKYFYEKREYLPIFIKDEEDSVYVNSVLGILSQAEDHGLSKNLYHYDLIIEELEKAHKKSSSKSEIYTHLANAELLTTDAVLKYAYHLRYGVIDPKRLFPDYSLPLNDASWRDLFRPLYQEHLIQYLAEIQPKNEHYKQLQIALKYYSSLQDHNWDTIAYKTQKEEIKERLQLLGFYDRVDQSDSTFVKTVAYFQKANGLVGDGTIGQSTLNKLNTPPSVYIEKIKLSMERSRWSAYRDSSKYVLVNIPDFYLHVIENGKEKAEIRVCTGKKRPASYEERFKRYIKSGNWRLRPDDWETPQTAGIITNIVLNPTWTVPPSIVREEIYNATIKDPEYLYRKNFKVFKDGKEVDILDVDLESYTVYNQPFTFVQSPGAGNALGKMKFIFKNRFGVYLHDTPTRGPFNNSYRAVSHGCVRVEKPYLLASLLLEGDSTWNVDYVKLETGIHLDDPKITEEYQEKRASLRRNISVGKSTFVKLKRVVPVFIDYYTAWVNEDGKMNIRDDVYGKDKILSKYFSAVN